MNDREQWVTHLVELWIRNDGEHNADARRIAHSAVAREDWALLGRYLRPILISAHMFTAAWHTAQDLAPNDYGRIQWETIARALTDDD